MATYMRDERCTIGFGGILYRNLGFIMLLNYSEEPPKPYSPVDDANPALP